MLALILNFLGGSVAKSALQAYQAKLTAGQTHEKLVTDLAIREAEIREQRDALAQQTVIAEQGHWYTACVRPLLALPFLVFNLKVIVWDKVLGWGVTDALSPDMLRLEAVIVAAYMGSLAVENASKIFQRK